MEYGYSIKLHIAGTGDGLEKIMNLQLSEMKKDIKIHGWLTEAELHALYKKMHLGFVLIPVTDSAPQVSCWRSLRNESKLSARSS